MQTSRQAQREGRRASPRLSRGPVDCSDSGTVALSMCLRQRRRKIWEILAFSRKAGQRAFGRLIEGDGSVREMRVIRAGGAASGLHRVGDHRSKKPGEREKGK